MTNKKTDKLDRGISIGMLVKHERIQGKIGLVARIKRCKLGFSSQAFLHFSSGQYNDWYIVDFLKPVN